MRGYKQLGIPRVALAGPEPTENLGQHINVQSVNLIEDRKSAHVECVPDQRQEMNQTPSTFGLERQENPTIQSSVAETQVLAARYLSDSDLFDTQVASLDLRLSPKSEIRIALQPSYNRGDVWSPCVIADDIGRVRKPVLQEGCKALRDRHVQEPQSGNRRSVSVDRL